MAFRNVAECLADWEAVLDDGFSLADVVKSNLVAHRNILEDFDLKARSGDRNLCALCESSQSYCN